MSSAFRSRCIGGLSLCLSLSLRAPAQAQTQAAVCAARPASLAPGSPPPAPGSVYHYTQPSLTVAANDRQLSVETRQSQPNDVFASSRRVILWDSRNDVYEDGTYVAHFAGRRMLSFHGTDLVLALQPRRVVEEIQLVSVLGPSKPLREWRPSKNMIDKAGTVRDTAGQGRYVVFSFRNVFDVQSWELIAEYHCNFRCTAVRPGPEDSAALTRASRGHRNFDNGRLRHEQVEGRAGFRFGNTFFAHDCPPLQTPGWGSGYVMLDKGSMVLLDD
jgi:hypothetical protein